MEKECVHCGICTRNCSFLQKYSIDIGDTDKLKELAYHCFLCGKCSEVCPKGIDGREKILKLRQENPAVKGFDMRLAEKRDYIFRNYRQANKKSVLFPGCNFPSFYPQTTKVLIEVLQKQAGMGVVYDCCGKPISDIGLKEDEDRIIQAINQRLQEAGVEKVVMLCPNCYAFLKSKLTANVISIYEKLNELGIGRKLEAEMQLFLPCPEREGQEMLKSMREFLPEQVEIAKDSQCCGLGGAAGYKEPELAKQMASSMKGKEIYTYCASCASNFAKNGCDKVHHVLVEMLDTNEKPDIAKSFVNRAKTKFL